MGSKQEHPHLIRVIKRLNHYPAMMSEEDPLHESSGRRDVNALTREIEESLRESGSAILVSLNFVGLRISQVVMGEVLKRGAMVTVLDGKDLPKQWNPDTEDEKRGPAGAMFFRQISNSTV